MGYIKRDCDNCGNEYKADTRNLNRGWGLCCSKSCAAEKREKDKPSYNPERVAANNVRRENWNNFGVSSKLGKTSTIEGSVQGITDEGYRIINGVAYDEFDSPVYNIDPYGSL